MDLSLAVTKLKGVTVVFCSGPLVGEAEARHFIERTEAVVAECPNIVVHLGGVRRMDSQGIGSLLAVRKMVEKAGGAMKLAAINDEFVRHTLEITRVAQQYEIFADEHQAVDSFSSGNSINTH